jgi:hypothetical protein
MKKQFSLFVGAAFCLASVSAFGVEPSSFAVFGIQLGQPKSALNPIGKFDCNATKTPNLNEICSAHLTVDTHPVLMLVSLNNGLIVDLDAIHQHSSNAVFEAVVQTAIKNYGDPQERKRNKHLNSEFVAWHLGHQQYSISMSGSEVGIGLDDTSRPPIPPAPPARLEQPATP